MRKKLNFLLQIVVIDGKSQQQCTNVPKYCSRNKDIFGNEVGNYMKDGGKTECGEGGDYWSDWDEEHKVPGEQYLKQTQTEFEPRLFLNTSMVLMHK